MEQLSEYDLVEVITDRAKYTEQGVRAGDQGIILGGERNGYVMVCFEGEMYQNADGVYCTNDRFAAMLPKDLKKIKRYTK